VHAAGLTPAALGDSISHALKERHLLRDPSVAIEVVAYRPVFILGEVAKPGQYPYQPGMSVLTAVAVAGGFTYRAVESYAAITRTPADGSGAVEGKVERSTRVEPGDVITVFERRF
jgi:polysaccharide export outer membrane protein